MCTDKKTKRCIVCGVLCYGRRCNKHRKWRGQKVHQTRRYFKNLKNKSALKQKSG